MLCTLALIVDAAVAELAEVLVAGKAEPHRGLLLTLLTEELEVGGVLQLLQFLLNAAQTTGELAFAAVDDGFRPVAPLALHYPNKIMRFVESS